MEQSEFIPRRLKQELLLQLEEYPIVTILGPRQAGKTTLAQHALPHFNYVSLETPHERAFAQEDPIGFLKKHPSPVIFDEIQRVPELLSYLQSITDASRENGQYVLTGSHQLSLRESISQSLAGRTGILQLLPLSIQELELGKVSFDSFEEYAFHGFLPRVHDQKQRPHIAYSGYYQTYVERDVRQLIQLKDTSLFQKFIKLLAGRTAQLLDYASLARDVGVDGKTIKHWLSILEASYIIFKLPPYFENLGKRVIKSPKYYFSDTGLLCHLLGIEELKQLERDPLIGHIFENLIVLECFKARYNQARQASLYFFRDKTAKEIDIVHASGRNLMGIEIKSSYTFHKDDRKNLDHFHQKISSLSKRVIAYNGDNQSFSDGLSLLNFKKIHTLFEASTFEAST